MKYFYDTEFLENGLTIELVSIGIVAEDGREYYAVNNEITGGRLVRRIRRHEWLMNNVVPTLPKPSGDWNNHMPKSWLFDYNSPLVKPYLTIADEVREFIRPADEEAVELWADFCAYDHVALCQLYGPMVDLPSEIPMWTHDLEQLWENAGCPDRPEQAAGQHNALEDARWNVELFKTCQAAAYPQRIVFGIP